MEQNKKTALIIGLVLGVIALCVIGVVITIGLVVYGTILVDYFNNMKDWREHAVEKNLERKAAEFNMRNR